MYAKINENKGHPVCVGIDPRIIPIGDFFAAELAAKGPIEFLKRSSISLVRAAASDSGVVKIQSAFFEMHGAEGWACLENIVRESRSMGVNILLDAKRGDISSTMQAYGVAAFDKLGVDALTVTPYMGVDVIKALEPWLKNGKFIYVVLWSSNPSSIDLQEQDLVSGDKVFNKLFRDIHNYLSMEGLVDQVGFVIGATNQYNEYVMSDLGSYSWLMPGIGAQGAKIDARFRSLFTSNKHHLIPISRGISGFGLKDLEEEISLLGSWDDYDSFTAKWYRNYSEMLSY